MKQNRQTKPMNTPITYYGGKQNLIKELLPLIPEHRLYAEAFAGGAALFFAKKPSKAEILNDLNGEIENFYRVAKTQFEELQNKIEGTLHSRRTYKEAMNIYDNPEKYDTVTRAWAFWVVTNQGFSAKIGSWAVSKCNKTGKTLANKRENFTTAYAERLKYIQIDNCDALKLIDRIDAEDTFLYADPPYFNSDCGHYDGYTEEEFEKLLKRLSKFKGKFLLSCYPSEILSKYVKKFGWHYKEIKQKVNVSHKVEKEKTEVLVFNYDAPDTPQFIPDKDILIKQVDTKVVNQSTNKPIYANLPAEDLSKAEIAVDKPVYHFNKFGMQQLVEKSKQHIEEYFKLIRNK